MLKKSGLSERTNEVDKYWKEAKEYVKARTDDLKYPPWFAFAWGSEAHNKWEIYLSWRLGFLPAGLRYLRQGTVNEFLVPCENPDEFDPRWKPRGTTT